jgi:hypothetical protein
MEEILLQSDDIVVVDYGNGTKEVRLGNLPRRPYEGFSVNVDIGEFSVKISEGLSGLNGYVEGDDDLLSCIDYEPHEGITFIDDNMIGFDTAHHCDYRVGWPCREDATYKTISFVKNELIKMVRSIQNFDKNKIEEMTTKINEGFKPHEIALDP